jgi:hypothetical protein
MSYFWMQINYVSEREKMVPSLAYYSILDMGNIENHV